MSEPINLVPGDARFDRAPGLLIAGNRVILPMTALAVEAVVSGPLADVRVVQTFTNPELEPLEAVYIFPLPSHAAVHGFRMRVGKRVIDGVVKAQQVARRVYRKALQEGRRTALMEQTRDNVFRVQVGNLQPRETVRIEITYAEWLEQSTAGTSFRFPLVVAPRYVPQDVAPVSPPLMAPGLHAATSLSIRLRLETGGVPVEDLSCTQHAVRQRGEEISLVRTDELLNRDFIVNFRLATDRPRAVLMVQGSHFVLSVVPPLASQETAVARDVIFVLDRSGSMSGVKMQSARKAVTRFLDTLGDADRFAILAFDNTVDPFQGASLCGREWLPVARLWVDSIHERGGTELKAALDMALKMPTGADRLHVVVVITDGQVGNEADIYRTVQDTPARIFTFGIDTAVNDAFLRRLAEVGRGTCELVAPGEALEEALDRLAGEIGTPLLTDLALEDRGLGLDPASLAPSRLPDVFGARPAVVMGACSGTGPITVQGRLPDGSRFEQRVDPTLVDNPALRTLWARARLQALEDRSRLLGEQHDAAMVRLSRHHQVLCSKTAFVLVDRSERFGFFKRWLRLIQPVELPADWDFGAVSKRGLLHRLLGGPSEANLGGAVGYHCAKKPESVVQLMQVDPVTVCVARDLLPLVDPNQAAPLLNLVSDMRRSILSDIGLIVPGVRFRDNLQLPLGHYEILIKDIPVASGELRRSHLLALGEVDTLPGESTLDPACGLPAKWVPHDTPAPDGVLLFAPAHVLASHLRAVLVAHAADLLGRQETQALLDVVRRTQPALVDALIPAPLSLGDLQHILKRLLQDGRSIADLPAILSAIAASPDHLTLASATTAALHLPITTP